MILEYNHEQIELGRVFDSIPRDAVVVDVGCGRGRNLDALTRLGFLNLIGVDVNPSLLEVVKEKGYIGFTPEEFGLKFKNACADVILLSHIVEHFEYRPLLDFLAVYLERLKPGGNMVVATPLMSEMFYNDFDHVKPYLPLGFSMVFARGPEQIQCQSDHMLSLQAIRFFRAPFRLQWHSVFYVQDGPKWPLWINRGLRLLFLLSRGRCGRRSGWIGRYRYEGRRIKLG
jgi:SAM-dependent methyltransferase